jgi:hypothetical protein
MTSTSQGPCQRATDQTDTNYCELVYHYFVLA